MKKEMRLINLSEIECWQVNLLPFDDIIKEEDFVLPFQLNCIANNEFGIGCSIRVIQYCLDKILI